MTQDYYLVNWVEKDVIVPGVGLVARQRHKQILAADSSAQAENIVKSAIAHAEEVEAVRVGRYRKTSYDPT